MSHSVKSKNQPNPPKNPPSREGGAKTEVPARSSNFQNCSAFCTCLHADWTVPTAVGSKTNGTTLPLLFIIHITHFMSGIFCVWPPTAFPITSSGAAQRSRETLTESKGGSLKPHDAFGSGDKMPPESCRAGGQERQQAPRDCTSMYHQ